MGYGQCVYRRSSGIYVARLCVPPALRDRVGRSEIHVSTGISVRSLAQVAAAAVLARWRQVFSELASLDLLKIVDGPHLFVGSGLLKITEAAELIGTTPAVLLRQLADERCSFWCDATGWNALCVAELGALDREDGEYTRQSVEGKGEPHTLRGVVQLAESGQIAESLAREGRAVVWQVCFSNVQAVGSVFVGPDHVWVAEHQLFAKKPDLEALRLRYAQNARIADIERLRNPPKHMSSGTVDAVSQQLSAPAKAVRAALDRHSDMTVSELIKKFTDAKTHVEFVGTEAAWKPDEELRTKQILRCFPELMGDPPMHVLEMMPEAEDIIREYMAKLLMMPTGPGLSKARKQNPSARAPELVSWRQTHSLPCMTAQTVQKYVSKLSECLHWGVTKTFLRANPAKGFKGDGRNRTQRPDQAREVFSGEELERIFGQAWFRTGGPALTVKGKPLKDYRPFHYWVPLLALYTGARPNELCQLYLSDVVTTGSEDYTAYLAFRLVHPDQINSDERDSPQQDKSLKTINSERNIPVHAELLRLGFMDYVDVLRKAGHKRLFPELRFDQTKGYGLEARKWFNERFLGNKLKIKRDGKKTLYSLRHNFATELAAQRIEGRIKDQIMGHARGDRLVEIRYTKDTDPKMLRAEIDKVNFKLPPIARFNIFAAMNAISVATQLKVSVAKQSEKNR